MPFVSGSDIVSDVLFRAGEIAGSSEWDTKVIDYVNRTYKALCAGSSEFLPEVVEDWWWMRGNGLLILDPVINAGTVAVTQGSASITFSIDPNITGTNARRFKVKGHPEVYVISSITGTAGTLDTVYMGETDAAAAYESYHTVYSLEEISTGVQAIISPIVSFYDNPQIFGTTPERMDFLFPLMRLSSGVPQAFCLESETTIRFSHGGKSDGKSMRMEFRYRPVVADIENTSVSIPLVPAHYRHLLADMALVQVFSDKNDDRVSSVGSQARSGLMAMYKENKRRLTKVDQNSGAIHTRQSGVSRRGVLRTESGLIIG